LSLLCIIASKPSSATNYRLTLAPFQRCFGLIRFILFTWLGEKYSLYDLDFSSKFSTHMLGVYPNSCDRALKFPMKCKSWSCKAMSPHLPKEPPMKAMMPSKNPCFLSSFHSISGRLTFPFGLGKPRSYFNQVAIALEPIDIRGTSVS